MDSNRNDTSEDPTDTKRKEVNLVLEISDIIDELNSINRLFQTQWDTLKAAAKSLSIEGTKHEDHGDRYIKLSKAFIDIIDQHIKGYMKQVERMTADADRTKKSVSVAIATDNVLEFFRWRAMTDSCLAEGPARLAAEGGNTEGSAVFERTS